MAAGRYGTAMRRHKDGFEDGRGTKNGCLQNFILHVWLHVSIELPCVFTNMDLKITKEREMMEVVLRRERMEDVHHAWFQSTMYPDTWMEYVRSHEMNLQELPFTGQTDMNVVQITPMKYKNFFVVQPSPLEDARLMLL
ncbi:hypothetical protein C0J52_08212 [Blattella germanica]|nr:hypothetical protein C0J52_08212 [Blattella germanica]